MRNLKISLCQHPTTLIFIDDDEAYLNQLCKHFKKHFPCLAFNKPQEAIQYLSQHQKVSFLQRCTKELSPDRDYDYFSLGINLKAIQKEIINPDRFKLSAIAAIDYSMPAMNGLEFCRQIKDPYMLKLLLTGNADANVAIKAFSKREINGYVPKAEPDVIKILTEEFKSLEKQYFLNLSNILLSQVQADILKYLEDEHVAEIFYKVCEENKIIEYALMDEAGDFILSDIKGKISRFSITSQDALKKMAAYAFNEKAPDFVVNQIKNKLQVPLFDSLEDISNTHPKEWLSFLYPIKKIPGSSEFYYAYKKNGVNIAPLFQNRCTFEAYLANL